MARMLKTNQNRCKECKYAFFIGSSVKSCDYYLITGKDRGCEVGYCDKFERLEGRRKQRIVPPMPGR